MGSTQGPGPENGRGGGGGAEDDGGEPSERPRSRSDNQRPKGNIGRPRNKPPPPPREVPIKIEPRPQENGQNRKRRRSSTPTAGASTRASRPRTAVYHAAPSADIARNHRPTGQGRERPPRKLSDNLKEGEYLTIVTLLAPNGTWVDIPNCLVSPYWNHSFMFPEAQEAIGYEPMILEDAESHTSVTPRGDNRDNTLVGLYMELKEMNRPKEVIVLPIFNKRKLGVSMVLGRPVIENWPPSVDTRYVAWDRVAHIIPTYDMMNRAPLYHGFWDGDTGVGFDPTMDPNVNVYLSGMGHNTINHDLTAVGAGIPADYSEFTPDWDWDGYLQEN